MFHAPIPMLKDEANLGQVKAAEIQMEVATNTMREAFDRAFGGAFYPRYVPEETRPMWQRMFSDGRRQYDQAKAVMEYHK